MINHVQKRFLTCHAQITSSDMGMDQNLILIILPWIYHMAYIQLNIIYLIYIYIKSHGSRPDISLKETLLSFLGMNLHKYRPNPSEIYCARGFFLRVFVLQDYRALGPKRSKLDTPRKRARPSRTTWRFC